MPWAVLFDDAFHEEFLRLPVTVQVSLAARARLLESFGPALGRPHADTLVGSKHANMKELRFDAGGGTWRAAYAFDPERRAIVLVAGDKAGTSQKRFYRELIAKADRRFGEHLERVAREGGRNA